MNENERRKETREPIVGDVSWALVDDANEQDGLCVETSKSGMCILTRIPVEEGLILRVNCKGSWMGERYAVVKSCKEVDADTYRCGLSIIKYY